MECTYRVRTDTITDEEGRCHTVYGIDAWEEGGGAPRLLQSVPDIFFDRERAEALADLCNSVGLSLIHLPHVIEDSRI